MTQLYYAISVFFNYNDTVTGLDFSYAFKVPAGNNFKSAIPKTFSRMVN